MKAAIESARNDALDAPVAPEEQRVQLEKMLRSEVFRPAPGLQKFLEFVASKTIEGLSHEIKEYTIGTEVFGRTDGYDPKIDTAVRVQAHRLREKLKEYYSGEGAGDGILVVIPKGHYIPSFSRRSTSVGKEFESQPPTAVSEAPEAANETLAPSSARSPSLESWGHLKKTTLLWLLAALAGVSLLSVFGVRLLPRRSSGTAAEQPEKPDRALAEASSPTNLKGSFRDLWADFLKDERSLIVAYSNAAFLATETSDLLRLTSDDAGNLGAPISAGIAGKVLANPRLLDRAGPVFFDDAYTGTGEVMGIFYLTRFFSQFHSPLEVKRSRLLTANDLTSHDVIFLGSTIENASLAGLSLPQDFVFVWPPQLVGVWSGRILNLHPQPGEKSSYEVERDPKTQGIRADYALVSFLPGMMPNRRIAILGGLTTFGTQAAADFATSPSQIAELAARLGTGPDTLHKKIPPFFQAVIRAEIMKGDILAITYVTGHAIHPTQHSSAKN